jgi:hypothetical protein
MHDDLTAAEILRLLHEHQGVDAELVVAEATPENSPLHQHFEWDDAIGGHQWRLQQARHLLRHIELPVTTSSGQRMMVPIAISIAESVGDERRYYLTQEVLDDKAMALRAALSALHRCSSTLRNVPHELTDLARLEIDEIILRAEKKAMRAAE